MSHTSNNDYNGVSTRMSQPSPFLDLPPELRNAIYREVLISDESIEANLTFRGANPGLGMRLGLLQICRQIRDEAHDIFWSENKFRFTVPNYTGRSVDNLLRIMDCRKAGLVSNLTIELQHCHGYRATLERCLVLVTPPSVPAIVVDTTLATLDAYRILTHGVPASSIKLVQPYMPGPLAPLLNDFWLPLTKKSTESSKRRYGDQ